MEKAKRMKPKKYKEFATREEAVAECKRKNKPYQTPKYLTFIINKNCYAVCKMLLPIETIEIEKQKIINRRRKVDVLNVVPKIANLRNKNIQWSKIEKEVGLTEITCRKYYREFLKVGKDIRKMLDPKPISEFRKKKRKRKEEILPKILEMKAQGNTIRKISEALSIDMSTIRFWLASK